MKKKNAAKVVSGAMLGFDGETVMIGGRVYMMMPPTIRRICGAAYYLSDIPEDMKEVTDVLRGLVECGKGVKALSWLIRGDLSIEEELLDGTLPELVTALGVGLRLMSAENFLRLSLLARSIAGVTARQR